MRDWATILSQLGVTGTNVAVWAPIFSKLMDAAFATDNEVAQFLAQVLHESGRLAALEENLNYSAAALQSVFGNRITADQAQQYGRVDGDHKASPQDIANIVYGGSWGQINLGNMPGTSDGWNFRGSGLIQITGRDNFKAATADTDFDFLSNPDHMRAPTVETLSASINWWHRHVPAQVLTSVEAVRKRVNPGLIGLQDTVSLFQQATAVLAA